LGLGKNWFKNQPVAATFDSEASAGDEVQVVAQLLGDHDPSGFVDLHNGIHYDIMPFILSFARYFRIDRQFYRA
jgi:hypothetical protein